MSSRQYVAFAITLLAVAAQAENVAAVAAGDRVRVRTSAAKLVGTVESVTSRELVISSPNSGPTVVSRTDVRRLQLSVGRSSGRGAVAGLVVGGLIGVGLGLWYKAALEETESDPMFAALPLIGAGVCGAAGAGVGALVKKEAWRELPVAGDGRSGAAPPRGIRLQLTIRF
jgi:hypothetical protein